MSEEFRSTEIVFREPDRTRNRVPEYQIPEWGLKGVVDQNRIILVCTRFYEKPYNFPGTDQNKSVLILVYQNQTIYFFPPGGYWTRTGFLGPGKPEQV